MPITRARTFTLAAVQEVADHRDAVETRARSVTPMTKRYLALDIETARLPDDSGDWRGNRPLGITCVALLGSDQDAPQLWHGKHSDGTPAPQMTPADLGGRPLR